MSSSQKRPSDTVVVDSIHGDIHLTSQERQIIDTASFQRLRHLKQLGMAQIAYPSATHTRFAHSLGVLAVMEKVVHVAKEALKLSDEECDDVRLAGLLHDIGHYPYSHLMEKLPKVRLTEELVGSGGPTTIDASAEPYPNHEEVGELILTSQQDLMQAIGGTERAQRIADLFRGNLADKLYLSKLVHSSLDVDRLDYLLRDAHATGVPYGLIDLNYLLNSLRVSPSGLLGVSDKALPAAEQCLFARFFMYRAVYYHKTIYGMEEACRQLLRRLQASRSAGLASDGSAIREIVTSKKLTHFTDAYVDSIVFEASTHQDEEIRALATSILGRKPPKLLKEVPVLVESGQEYHAGTVFKQRCLLCLQELANKFSIPLGRFLFCETKPLQLEQRGTRLSEAEAREIQPEEREELIRVFRADNEEPESIVNLIFSIASVCSNHVFQTYRLYVVQSFRSDELPLDELRAEVADWDRPDTSK